MSYSKNAQRAVKMREKKVSLCCVYKGCVCFCLCKCSHLEVFDILNTKLPALGS